MLKGPCGHNGLHLNGKEDIYMRVRVLTKNGASSAESSAQGRGGERTADDDARTIYFRGCSKVR